MFNTKTVVYLHHRNKQTKQLQNELLNKKRKTSRQNIFNSNSNNNNNFNFSDMKKNLIIAALSIVTLSSFTSKEINLNLIEAINTTEDLKEWIKYDIEENRLSNDIGQTYINNLNELQKNLSQLK